MPESRPMTYLPSGCSRSSSGWMESVSSALWGPSWKLCLNEPSVSGRWVSSITWPSGGKPGGGRIVIGTSAVRVYFRREHGNRSLAVRSSDVVRSRDVPGAAPALDGTAVRKSPPAEALDKRRNWLPARPERHQPLQADPQDQAAQRQVQPRLE